SLDQKNMDLDKFNEVARGRVHRAIGNIFPLKKDQTYYVSEFRPVKSKDKFRLMAVLDHEWRIFIPSRACRALQENKEFYYELQEVIKNFKLFVKYLDDDNGKGLEFSLA
ncbi:hypothetical protein, partial [Escherichia coli]|uniref:hypothetical protein n=1 Tax=Escherichia coli TaxID=562 RepID=UPI002915C807